MDEPYRIIIAPEAAGDLAAIHNYIAQDSSVHAAKTVQRILDAIATLRLFPHRTVYQRGSSSSNIIRTLPVGPYIIFFRAHDNQQIIRILTIRHGARRRPRRFA
jgi:plasmid stabilization system protein ParE